MAVKLSKGQELFARRVALATGLSLVTVRTWVRAEGGPDSNPLNIMGWDASGRRYVRDFGNPQAAATNTIKLLRGGNQTYAHLLRTARDPRSTPRDELQAIIDSDWEESGYQGSTDRKGSLLWGAYAAVSGNRAASPPSTSTTVPAMLPGLLTPLPRGGAPGADKAKDALTGWVGDLAKWIGEQAGKAFLYFALTLLALVLIVFGSMRALGVGPGALRSQLSRERVPGTGSEEIPF